MKEVNFSNLDVSAIKNHLVLLDIDGTITGDGSAEITPAALAKLDELKASNRVVFCTNKKVSERNEALARLTGVPVMALLHRKPSRKILNHIDNPQNYPLLVIGDKYLTDGLFARNVRARFLKVKRLTAADGLIIKLIYLIDDSVYVTIDLFRLIRPRQWLKNLLIFVPVFFAKEILSPDKLQESLIAFIVFCLAASSAYIINDILDRKQDSVHPVKKFRPIASGRVGISSALMLWAALLSAGLALTKFYLPQIFYLAVAYVLLNFLYSFYFKHVVILDIIFISGFYLIRILVGGLASATPISSWLILCTIFVSLFLVVGKRLAETKHIEQREVLGYYNKDILNQLLVISAALTVVSYGIYSILGVRSTHAVYSILFVVLGIFRYLFLIYQSDKTEFPEKIIFSDKVILGSVLAWGGYMYLIFYLNY